MSSELNYLSTCACVDAMDRIASKTYLRLSYEYGICILKRELIPTLASVSLKSMISNISSLRENNDMSAYVNLYDLVTFGLVELNFDETEKATNILPDFRIGPRGCKASGMDYNKYISKQVPIEKYDGRVLEVKSEDLSNVTWNDLLQQMIDAIYGNVNFIMDDKRIMTIFFLPFIPVGERWFIVGLFFVAGE